MQTGVRTTKGLPGAAASIGSVLAMVGQLRVTVRARGTSCNCSTEMSVNLALWHDVSEVLPAPANLVRVQPLPRPQEDSPLKICRWVQTPMQAPKAHRWPVGTQTGKGCGPSSRKPCPSIQSDEAEPSGAEMTLALLCCKKLAFLPSMGLSGQWGHPGMLCPTAWQTLADPHCWEPPYPGASQCDRPLP